MELNAEKMSAICGSAAQNVTSINTAGGRKRLTPASSTPRLPIVPFPEAAEFLPNTSLDTA